MKILYPELTRLSVALLATLGVTTLPPASAVAQDGTSKVFAPKSKALGKKFQDWSAEWWQFVLSIPAAENPLVDETGDKCSIGQRGPVWFLFGGFGGTISRACSIPEGTALFFPIINHVSINDSTQTAAELRSGIAPCLDSLPPCPSRSTVFPSTSWISLASGPVSSRSLSHLTASFLRTSLKRFYTFLFAKGLIDKEELNELEETIKGEMPEWLATLKRYDDPSIEDVEDIWRS